MNSFSTISYSEVGHFLAPYNFKSLRPKSPTENAVKVCHSLFNWERKMIILNPSGDSRLAFSRVFELQEISCVPEIAGLGECVFLHEVLKIAGRGGSGRSSNGDIVFG